MGRCSDEAGARLVLRLVTSGADCDGDDGEAALDVALKRNLPLTAQALLQCGVTPPETLPEQVGFSSQAAYSQW